MALYEQTDLAITNHPFPLGAASRPDLVAKWIARVAPSGPRGHRQSRAVTGAITSHLRGQGVPDHVLFNAMSLSGYRFTPDPTSLERYLASQGRVDSQPFWWRPAGSGHATMQQAPKNPLDGLKMEAARLEVQFQVARASGNSALARSLAAKFLALLAALGSKGSTRMERDREALAWAREQLLRNAPTITRVLGPGVRDQPMPPPDGLRSRPPPARSK